MFIEFKEIAILYQLAYLQRHFKVVIVPYLASFSWTYIFSLESLLTEVFCLSCGYMATVAANTEIVLEYFV